MFITHKTRILFHKAHLYKSIRFIFTCEKTYTANRNCVQLFHMWKSNQSTIAFPCQSLVRLVQIMQIVLCYILVPRGLVQSLNSPFFPPHIGAEPGRAKEESRITCMRMPRTNQSKITTSQPRRSRQCVVPRPFRAQQKIFLVCIKFDKGGNSLPNHFDSTANIRSNV